MSFSTFDSSSALASVIDASKIRRDTATVKTQKIVTDLNKTSAHENSELLVLATKRVEDNESVTTTNTNNNAVNTSQQHQTPNLSITHGSGQEPQEPGHQKQQQQQDTKFSFNFEQISKKHLPPTKRFKNYIHHEEVNPCELVASDSNVSINLNLNSSSDQDKAKLMNTLLGLANIALEREDN